MNFRSIENIIKELKIDIMKDYSKQIKTILVTCLRLQDGYLDSDGKHYLDILGLSKAVREINEMIQLEVNGLELQVVELTDQLFESDTLLIEAKKAIIPRISHSKPRANSSRTDRAAKFRAKSLNK
jgi:hypothetical protein